MIWVYVHDLSATGVVRNARLIAADLAAAGHRVALVTALPGGEPPSGVAHHVLLPRAGRSRLLEKVRAALALRRRLRRAPPDLLISAGNHGHGVAWAGSRGARGMKTIYRISNDLVRAVPGAPSSALSRWLRGAMVRRMAADATHLVLVSDALAATPALAAASRAGRVSVIVNGIDPAAARARIGDTAPHPWLADTVPVLLAIGRLAPQKNLATLQQAFALVRRTTPARLVILGESRDTAAAALMAQAQALGVAADILLPGRVDPVFPWLARCAVFVLPSWWEGCANVLLEAMALDTPSVASSSAGNAAHLLDHGRCGVLVDPADPAAMARGILAQLDPATRVHPGRRIDAFTMDRVSAAWRALAARLLAA